MLSHCHIGDPYDLYPLAVLYHQVSHGHVGAAPKLSG